MQLKSLAGKTFTFMGRISQDSASDVIRWLLDHANSKEQLTVLLSSEGGSVSSAFAIHDTIQAVVAGGARVNIVVVGKCQSSAIIVLLSVGREYRFATANARFMVHCMTLTTDTRVLPMDPYIDDPQIIDVIAESSGLRYKELRELQEAYFSVVIAETRLADKLAREMTARTTYFGVDIALEHDFVSCVVNNQTPQPAAQLTRWQRCKRRCRHPFRRFSGS